MLGKEVHSIEKKDRKWERKGGNKFRNITDVLNSLLKGKVEYSQQLYLL